MNPERKDEIDAKLNALRELMKPQHLGMAELIASGSTQADAYVKTGGKSKNPRRAASDLIRTNPNIQEYVDLLKELAAESAKKRVIGSFEHKKELLMRVANQCTEELQEVWEGYGEDRELVGYKFDSRGAVAAVSELNKMDGDHAAIKTSNKHTHQFEELSDDELNAEIERLSQEAETGETS